MMILLLNLLLQKKIGEVLKTVNDLQNEIFNMDPDTERAMKLQRGLNDLFSGYQELYKQLKKSTSQSLMTNYFVREETNEVPENSLTILSTHNENTSSDKNDDLPIDDIDSSSDGSDIEPIQKRCRQGHI